MDRWNKSRLCGILGQNYKAIIRINIKVLNNNTATATLNSYAKWVTFIEPTETQCCQHISQNSGALRQEN